MLTVANRLLGKGIIREKRKQVETAAWDRILPPNKQRMNKYGSTMQIAKLKLDKT